MEARARMVQPLIGVTPGFAGPSEQRAFCRTANVLYVDQNYLARVEEAGGLPTLLPHLDDPALVRALVERLDGLLLTGGEDVHPNHYGQEIEMESCEVSVARDGFELRLLEAFLATGRPVLAICRGIQILNVALGGTLIQDIPAQLGMTHHSQQRPSALPSHEVWLREDSRLARALGSCLTAVNSHHHQAVDRVGNGLRAVGWSEEGIVEAVEHTARRYLIGVQWHPERLSSEGEAQRRLFGDFVGACREQADGGTTR